MPHIEATGILVHTPVTHGHIITVVATPREGKITKDAAIKCFEKHPRIRVVSIDEGFQGSASFFRYARDLGNRRGDMYEVGLWRDAVVETGDAIMFAINIPRSPSPSPRPLTPCALPFPCKKDGAEGTAKTNQYLKIGKGKSNAIQHQNPGQGPGGRQNGPVPGGHQPAG